MKSKTIRATALAAVVVGVTVVVAMYIIPLVRERNNNVELRREWAGLLK
jgi:hypothetical protein